MLPWSAAPPEVAIPAMVALLGMDYGPLLGALDLPIIAVNAADCPTDETAIRRLEPARNRLSGDAPTG